jgi:hypothetical protein
MGLVLLPLVAGCAGTRAALERQAIEDLRCADVRIRIVEESDHVRSAVVTGCGLDVGYWSSWWGKWQMDYRSYFAR